MIGLWPMALAAMAAPIPTQNANPLAPAVAGRLQCYAPDRAKRTCQSLASYVPNSAGGFDNTVLVVISVDPLITHETVTPVTVKQGAVCGYIRPEDLRRGVMRREGKPLTAGQAKPLLDQIERALTPMLNREVCTQYVPSGDHLIARGTLDGVKDGLPDVDVIWVSPEEGYRVAG